MSHKFIFTFFIILIFTLGKSNIGLSQNSTVPTLDETLSYIKTRLNTYESVENNLKTTINSIKIEMPLFYSNFSQLVAQGEYINIADIKSIDLVSGNIVISGKSYPYGIHQSLMPRPSAITIFLGRNMSIGDKEKLLKAFKHLASLKNVKLINDDLF